MVVVCPGHNCFLCRQEVLDPSPCLLHPVPIQSKADPVRISLLRLQVTKGQACPNTSTITHPEERWELPPECLLLKPFFSLSKFSLASTSQFSYKLSLTHSLREWTKCGHVLCQVVKQMVSSAVLNGVLVPI
jgi:hypothetical protein